MPPYDNTSGCSSGPRYSVWSNVMWYDMFSCCFSQITSQTTQQLVGFVSKTISLSWVGCKNEATFELMETKWKPDWDVMLLEACIPFLLPPSKYNEIRLSNLFVLMSTVPWKDDKTRLLLLKCFCGLSMLGPSWTLSMKSSKKGTQFEYLEFLCNHVKDEIAVIERKTKSVRRIKHHMTSKGLVHFVKCGALTKCNAHQSVAQLELGHLVSAHSLIQECKGWSWSCHNVKHNFISCVNNFPGMLFATKHIFCFESPWPHFAHKLKKVSIAPGLDSKWKVQHCYVQEHAFAFHQHNLIFVPACRRNWGQ